MDGGWSGLGWIWVGLHGFVNNILSLRYKYLIEYIENRGQLAFNNKNEQK